MFRDVIEVRRATREIVGLAWVVWAVYWFFSAWRVNKMKKREPAAQRLAFLFITVFALFLLTGLAPGDFLHRHFVRPCPWIGMTGAGLTVAGLGFAIWARAHIGQYWSGSVALREGHELIGTGPYKRTRHPIYSGILLALAGSALALGEYRAILLFGVLLAALTVKAKREEALLAGEFGAAFEEHKRRTGFYLPKLS